MNIDYFADTEGLITVRDWLRFGVSRMNQEELHFGHGTHNAFDETAYLLLRTLHLPPDRLEPFLDACLTESEREEVLAAFELRIKQRLPAAYITHEAWLGDFSFYVDERVIIPRSFIAQLLRERLAPWIVDPECVTSTLDLCTGSGCLAILLADAFPNADVDAVDISAEALMVAARNVEDYEFGEQITLLQSDLFSELLQQQYDIIITNPPYVNAPSMATLPPEYQAEPSLALASGADGLKHIRSILKEAANYLYPQGILVAEIGHNRAALEAEFSQLPFAWVETDGSDEFVFILTKEQLNLL